MAQKTHKQALGPVGSLLLALHLSGFHLQEADLSLGVSWQHRGGSRGASSKEGLKLEQAFTDVYQHVSLVECWCPGKASVTCLGSCFRGDLAMTSLRPPVL